MTNTALSLSAYTLDKVIAVNAGETQKLTYTLNLSDSGLQINPDAANAHTDTWATDKKGNTDNNTFKNAGAQRLGTITFTFSEYAPAGSKSLTQRAVELGINTDNISAANDLLETADFYLMDLTTGQVFDVDDVKAMAEDISAADAKGKTSVYKAMFDNYVLSDEGTDKNGDISLYLCRTKSTDGSFYRLRVIGVGEDIKSEDGNVAGITFQFRNYIGGKLGWTRIATSSSESSTDYRDILAYKACQPGGAVYELLPFKDQLIGVTKSFNISFDTEEICSETMYLFNLSLVEYYDYYYFEDHTLLYDSYSVPFSDYAWLSKTGLKVRNDRTSYSFYYERVKEFGTFYENIGFLTDATTTEVTTCDTTTKAFSMFRTICPGYPNASTSTKYWLHFYAMSGSYTNGWEWVNALSTVETSAALNPAFCF